MTLRVLQAMSGAPQGGAEGFFERLSIALHKRGQETGEISQEVVIRRNPKRAKKLRDAGLRPHEISFGGRLDLRSHLAFRKVIRDFQPHIVLTWMNRASRLCPKGKFLHVARLGGYYKIKNYQKCHHLIGNTTDIVRYLREKGWDKARSHHIPNFFIPQIPAQTFKRQDFGVPTEAPLVIAMGRLHHNKAFDTLLRAMAQVSDAILWLAGQGPEEAALKSLARDLRIEDRVRFLGWQDDIAALLAAGDIFICPSRHEPLGNVILEAWGQKIPILSTATQGPSLLIQDSDNGALVPIDAPEVMGERLREMIESPDACNAMASRGYDSLMTHFSERKVVDLYCNFFRQLLQEQQENPFIKRGCP